MKCPDCNCDMEKGFLQGGNMMTWVRKPHILTMYPKKGEVMVGRNPMNAVSVTAFICKDCKKIIVDYKASDYNER